MTLSSKGNEQQINDKKIWRHKHSIEGEMKENLITNTFIYG